MAIESDDAPFWIEAVDEEDASEELRALYDRARDPSSGTLDHIMAVHGLDPEGLEAHLALYESAMRGTRTLRKVDREMIAFVVSRANDCHY